TRHFLGVRRWSAIAPGVRPSRSETSSRVGPLRTKSTKASRSASGKAATSQCMTSVGRTHEQLDRVKALREADYRTQGLLTDSQMNRSRGNRLVGSEVES